MTAVSSILVKDATGAQQTVNTLPPLGQAASVASLPVTVASDQGDLPANIAQVGGSALSLGQKASTASVPVVIAADQAAIATKSGASISSATLTVGTSASYASDDVIGGVVDFTVASSGTINEAIVTFASTAYQGGVDLLIFDAAPSGGGYTDGSALALTATDLPKLIGVIHANDARLLSTSASSCQAQNAGVPFTVAGTTLWVVPVLNGPTSAAFSTAGDVSIRLGIA